MNAAVLKYLRSGIEARMDIPDAADPKLETVRVLTQDAAAD